MTTKDYSFCLWDALLAELSLAHSGNDAQTLLWLRDRVKEYADSHSSELLGAERPVPADDAPKSSRMWYQIGFDAGYNECYLDQNPESESMYSR